MNKCKLLSILLVITLLTGVISISVYGAGKTAKVTEFAGTVTVRRSGAEKDIKVFKGMALSEGDKINTGADGSITITIDDNKFIKADSDSSFTINNLKGTGDDAKTGFTLIYGSVYNEVNQPSESEDTYTIRTANTVMGVRSTIFKVKTSISGGNEIIEVIVLEGTVYIRPIVLPKESGGGSGASDGSIDLESGTMWQFTADPNGNLTPAGASDGGAFDIDIDLLDKNTLQWIVENGEHVPDIAKEAKEVLETSSTISGSAGGSGKGDSGNGGGSGATPTPTSSPGPVDPSPTPPPTGSLMMTAAYQSEDGATFHIEFDQMITLDSEITVVPEIEYTGDIINEGDAGRIEIPTSAFREPGVNYKMSFENVRLLSDSRVVCESGGSEFVGDSYNIRNNAMLALFHDGEVDATIINLEADLDVSGYDFNGNTSGNWNPVKLDSIAFYGNGHTIQGISVNILRPTGGMGFFDTVENGAVVTGLHLKDISVSTASGSNVGGLAGKVVHAVIRDCTVTGDSVVKAGLDYVGGLIGYAEDTLIKDCTVADTTVNASGSYVGGLVGQISGATSAILNPGLSGDIKVLGSTKDGVAGGVAGGASDTRISADITGKDALVPANLTVDAGGETGGIIGIADNCDLEGVTLTVKETMEIKSWNDAAGGVLGLADNSRIREVGFRGAQGSVTAQTNAGGIAGQISSTQLTLSKVTSDGGDFSISASNGMAGGLVAYAVTSDITKSYAAGEAVTVRGSSYAGGIVGGMNAGSLSYSYAAVKTAAAGIGAGSIAGESSGTIDYCHGQTQADGGMLSGGIIGYNMNKVSNCVYLSDTDVNIELPVAGESNGTEERCFSLDGLQMTDIGNDAYATWQMGTVWQMGQDYPVLVENPVYP